MVGVRGLEPLMFVYQFPKLVASPLANTPKLMVAKGGIEPPLSDVFSIPLYR